ncbi:MAG: 1-acyl-sn-glycerol-3-phosphate acyltransferase, partial [Myxococcota bacterium]
LLQVAMLHQGLADQVESPRFEPLAVDQELTWTYRGQVRMHHRCICSVLDVTEVGEDDRGPWMRARASLWVDGMRIYETRGLGMRIVSGVRPVTSLDTHLTLATQPWLGDHRPTWTVPALPMMSMVEHMAAAALRPDSVVVGLEQVRAVRWLPIPESGVVLKAHRVPCEHDDRVKVTLSSDDGVVATGMVHLARSTTAGEAPWPPLAEAVEEPNPYTSGTLFHGPALHVLQELKIGRSGASAILDADPGEVPLGVMHQRLLDAATHAIPHDQLERWCADIEPGQVGYPAWIPTMTVHGPAPTSGRVRCEVRFDGFAGSNRLPRFRLQLIWRSQVWCAWTLVEALFPKGPLGSAPPLDRRAFLRDRRYRPGVLLSTVVPTSASSQWVDTRLQPDTVAASDWLPGTVEALYGTTVPETIAQREHLAYRLKVHPGVVHRATPLSHIPLEVESGCEGEAASCIAVRSPKAVPALDLTSVEAFWERWFGCGRWPVEDLYYGLIARCVRHVITPAPDALEAVRGRSCLFVANHQVGVESLLFAILASGLLQVPTVTLAKAEHRTSWLGQLIAHSFTYPGVADPHVITFFDRTDKAALGAIVEQLGASMAVAEGRSVMVHVEGTRSLSCRTPVRKMSGAFIDMALQVGAPIVPVRFVGGLPVEPLEARREFPVGYGRQDIWIGRPRMPETLKSMTYGERKREVLTAINTLGPSAAQEVPHSPDRAFEAEVERAMAATGAQRPHATLWAVLSEMEAQGQLRCPEWTPLLIDPNPAVLDQAPEALRPWLATVRRWLWPRQ